MGITCFTALTQCFQVFYILYVHVSEMLCTFPSSCARFTEVVHISQQLCTFHRSCARVTEVVHVSQTRNNVRVQLYTHWAHSNQQKHWGDQTHSPDIIIYVYVTCNYILYILYIYIYCIYIYWIYILYIYIYIVYIYVVYIYIILYVDMAEETYGEVSQKLSIWKVT